MEQDLTRDPVTGFAMSDPRRKDAHQNDNYVRHSNPAETARDYSRPHTIPPDEFEAATGKRHADAVAEYEKNEEERLRAEEEKARARR